jgi:hypothetical protein
MRKSIQPLSRRVLSRLAVATANELDLWLRDDVKIAHRTVLHAAYGDAVLCSPDVLSSYEILGIHPEKVWPAIQARSDALGPLDVAEAPPKKAAQSAKLWPEETNEARVASPCLAVSVLREPTTRPPMAAPSIAALYPKSDDPSSAKKRDYSYDDLLLVVRKSHAPASIVAATVNAVTARGRWPEYDGPVSKILCVSLDGMMLGGGDGDRNVVRSTARWRARRAVKLGYWKRLRKANSWSNCPKCGAERVIGKCGKFDESENFAEGCGYTGRAKTPEGKANFDEFCRTYMYELNVEKFLNATPAKGILHFNHRTYQEHKEAAKRGEHPNVTEMPARKPAHPVPPDPPPAKAAPAREKPAAEHRSPERAVTTTTTQITADATLAARQVFDFCGLADPGLIEKIKIGVLAEAKFQGIEMRQAAKYVAEAALQDQRAGVTLNGFYWRDLKWRTAHGPQHLTPSATRSARSKESLASAWRKFRASDPGRSDAGEADFPDSPELKE